MLKKRCTGASHEPEEKKKKLNTSSNHHYTMVIHQIPSELLIHIFEFLNGCELLLNVSPVSKAWHGLISNQLDWKLLVSRRLGFSPMAPPVILKQINSSNEFWKLYFIEKIAKHKYNPVAKFLQENPNLSREQVFGEGTTDNKNIKRFISFEVEYISQEYVNALFHHSEQKQDSALDRVQMISDPFQFFWKSLPLFTGFSLKNGDEYMAIGESKIGGCPDFPRNFEWPKSNGKEWRFVAQVNLQQLEYFDLTNRVVPKGGGMLYFFAPSEASHGGSYWGVRKSDPQPITHFSAQQIKEMGGLERRNPSSLSMDTTPLERDEEDEKQDAEQSLLYYPPVRMNISSHIGSSSRCVVKKLFSAEKFQGNPPAEEVHLVHFIKDIHSSLNNNDHTQDQNQMSYLHVQIAGFGSLHGDLSELEQALGVPISSLDMRRLFISRSAFDAFTDNEMELIPSNTKVVLNPKTMFGGGNEAKFQVGTMEQVKPLLKSNQYDVYLPYSFVSEQQWHDKANRQFIYQMDSEEEKKLIMDSSDYLDAKERYSKFLEVLSVGDETMNLENWDSYCWMYCLPSYCFEKGVIEKSFCESYDP
ncbi:hypothetical protein C9374_009741 [Naegleria lovaniensis]|uniref:F-box domain-containing protein n=1 Tax=Naegleria lovaniensis TaxID=51637 RepID=A0AA88GYY6_NAELO|nr:uncharacterized protein C9374_009741 [Naegleria lovaniensis]KAG2393164.1 hypothetical protein C9374_009741 [Naegleria lovaniensis]